MGRSFEILSGNQRVVAQLLDREAPNVARAFTDHLPCESFSVHAKFAGEELIVMVPFFSEPENEIFAVEPGDIGYYPGRQTICIFYGDTEPFGHVSVFAKVTEGLDVLQGLGSRRSCRSARSASRCRRSDDGRRPHRAHRRPRRQGARRARGRAARRGPVGAAAPRRPPPPRPSSPPAAS